MKIVKLKPSLHVMIIILKTDWTVSFINNLRTIELQWFCLLDLDFWSAWKIWTKYFITTIENHGLSMKNCNVPLFPKQNYLRFISKSPNNISSLTMHNCTELLSNKNCQFLSSTLLCIWNNGDEIKNKLENYKINLDQTTDCLRL